VSRLRLGSFNLLSGRSPADGVIDADRLIEATRLLDVDVLAVQEVDRHQPRSGGVDQAALIADTLGAVDHRFAAALDGTPGIRGWLPSAAGVRPDGVDSTAVTAQFGVALISRLPVAEWHELRLSPARGRYPLPIPSRPPRLMWLNDEPRVAVAAVLQNPRITIACTHLSFVPTSNVRQLKRVRAWLAGLPGPHLLLGDLNLPGAAVRRITGWTPLVSSPTFPSWAPRLQLDHVLASGLPPGSQAVGRVKQLPISDHQAVLVDLTMR
jgi:endonuclease/exonuclease/phosphatase family metal-dependent hydrolase